MGMVNNGLVGGRKAGSTPARDFTGKLGNNDKRKEPKHSVAEVEQVVDRADYLKTA